MENFLQNAVFFMFLTGFILTAQVFAQLEGNPENLCRNGFFPRESEIYRIARVTGKPGERVYFYGDEREDCPAGKNCRLKSYVLPNDEIIVSRYFKNFACAWFQPKKGSETVGWIPSGNLEVSDDASVIKNDGWAGKWSFYDNSIVISKTGAPEVFKITGNALWKGLGDNVHVGEIDDAASLKGDVLKIGENDADEDACKVSMRLVGKYLIVSDNLQCGGANVSFSGVYQKSSSK